MTLSSIRGGTIPFETASLESTDPDHKIVHRFFEDGSLSTVNDVCRHHACVPADAAPGQRLVMHQFVASAHEWAQVAAPGMHVVCYTVHACITACHALSQRDASLQKLHIMAAEEVVTDIHNTASIAYQLASDYDILYIVGGAAINGPLVVAFASLYSRSLLIGPRSRACNGAAADISTREEHIEHVALPQPAPDLTGANKGLD